MKIGIPAEIHEGEKRVAATPDTAEQLIKLGFSLCVESGAGEAAGFSDQAYGDKGAEIIWETERLWGESDIILKVRSPEYNPSLERHESDLLREGASLVSFIQPAMNSELLDRLSRKKATVLAMDCVPRITRAQKLDVLSSMANIAGYRAVIEAASHFGRFFTGQITAAGKIAPAKVLVIGAGVAGLSAIGTAGGMGAIVRAFDTRLEVREQIESMGASFLELDFAEESHGEGGYAKVMSPEFIRAEMALFEAQAKEVDIIITTAMIPGKKAPLLLTAPMVQSMKKGSVIVDLAAEQGGNCELTEPGEVAVRHGVTLIGYTDLASRLASQSSQLYGNNLHHLLQELTPDKNGRIELNMEDEVIRGMTVLKEGEITWPPPAVKMPPSSEATAPADASTRAYEAKPKKRGALKMILPFLVGLGAILLAWLGNVAPPDFLEHLTVFVLACFTGYMVIWNVTPALHTPLMSVTNAISGIIVIGALLQVSGPGKIVTLLAAVAVLIATINVAGGFLVTQRMLKMFKRGERDE